VPQEALGEGLVVVPVLGDDLNAEALGGLATAAGEQERAGREESAGRR
jgi:hypothetical protein